MVVQIVKANGHEEGHIATSVSFSVDTLYVRTKRGTLEFRLVDLTSVEIHPAEG